MIKRIFVHELRRLWRDKSLPIITLLMLCAALFASYNGARHARLRLEANNVVLADDGRIFSELQQQAHDIETGSKGVPAFGGAIKSSSVGLFYPRTAALPPSSLAFSSIGQSDVYPSFFKVSGRQRDAFMDAQELENPTNLLIGRFDLAFVVVYLVPLFAFALCYNILSGERESGTLALLIAQGARLRSLLLGKTLARVCALLVPLVVAALCAMLWYDLGEGATSPASIVLKFTLWCAVVVAYALFWFSVAALVSLYGSTSASNAVTLAAVWIGFVILTPTFIHLAAQAVRPVPSRLELINASRDIQEQVLTRDAVPLLEAYYRENPQARPANKDITKYDFPFHYTAIQRERERRIAPLLGRYETALAAQQNFARWAALFSPALVAQESLNDLAGTGYARYRLFVEQVIDYHRAHKDFFEPLALRDARLTSADYDRMPRFAFREEASAALSTRIVAALLALSFAGALTLFLIRRKVRRHAFA